MRALVTGASRGIGRATALRLAEEEDAEIAVHCHDHPAEAEETVQGVRRRGATAFVLRADLSLPAEVTELAREISLRWDRLDALVHNAGSYPRMPFSEVDGAAFETCFRTNVFGPAELTRLLLGPLEKARPGRVVFVSSVLASDGSRHGAHYAASKAALVGLARSLARELAPRILVNVVSPGATDTAILAHDTPELRRKRERLIPLGRVGRPEEIAEAIAFMATARSSYLTGATLEANGGLRMG